MNPTILQNGKSNQTPRTAVKRHHETFNAAMAIHGGTEKNACPAIEGMFDTLCKRSKLEHMTKLVSSNEKLQSRVASDHCSRKIRSFETSNENVLRSIACYYSGGVMGKRKYKSVRLVLATKASTKKRGGRAPLCFMQKGRIPKLLPYDKLMSYIKQVDIGKVYSVEEEFFNYIQADEVVHGCFRDLRDYLPRLAKFYLHTKQKSNEALKWFSETEGTFLVALGGDGCPFGKNTNACSFLVSFLNVGKQVASSSDNFLVFGANCESESCGVVQNYVKYACKQMKDLEGKVFAIGGFHVTFKFEELPNDMKMLATLAGELPNSARYFSTFATVSTEDYRDLEGQFATGNCKWKVWDYNERLKVAQSVAKFKETLPKHLNAKTSRSKVTSFIASKKSRQEFVPLVGKYIDLAHVEPLHLKNNAWQHYFKGVLKEAISKSKLPETYKTFADVPEESCFHRVITALRYELKCSCLARKVVKWYGENQGKDAELQYRFTGKESRMFCQNFMRVIKQLRCEGDSRKQRLTVAVYAYIGVRLRDSVSLFSRIEITTEQLLELRVKCKQYFRANALFLPSMVTPTVWTLGHVVPQHTEQLFQIYHQGLGTVTMEGREAKHIVLKKLSENSSSKNQWFDIFQHEFVMLIWLPENGFTTCQYKASKDVYIPRRDNSYCSCGLQKAQIADDKCCICSDMLTNLVEQSVEMGKCHPQLRL